MSNILCLVGHSGSGKTTVLAEWARFLVGLGCQVGLVKHSHHAPAADETGKDSAILKACGPAWFHFAGPDQEGWVEWVRERAATVDLVLVEGGSLGPFPKLEVLPWQGGPARLPEGEVLARIGGDLPRHDPAAWTAWLRTAGLLPGVRPSGPPSRPPR